MLPDIGTHMAHVTEARVGETKGGALQLALNCRIDEQTSIVAYQYLSTRDGTLNQKTIDNMKEVFGWNGSDPFWFEDTDLSGIQISIVVEDEEYNGDLKRKVRWINSPGNGSGGMGEKADRNAILAKYGNRFRAMAGGTPMAPRPKPAAPAAPATPAAPVTPQAEPSTQNEFWAECCTIWPDQAQATEAYHKSIRSTGKTAEALSPQEWGALKASLPALPENEQLPF